VSSNKESRILQDLRSRACASREGSETDERILADIAHHPAERRPPLFRAIAKDVLTYAYHRDEMSSVQSRIGRWLYVFRLPFVASEFFALALYRLRVALRARHIPLIPAVINWTCAVCWELRIADSVIIDEGVYIAHGQVNIGGLTYIGKRCFLAPFVGIGLIQGYLRGPRLEGNVFVDTGARILGPLTVGYGARIGANAAVLSDVPAWAAAVGVPARIIPRADTDALNSDPENTPCAPS
jgi:serine O-acetyltransferase